MPSGGQNSKLFLWKNASGKDRKMFHTTVRCGNVDGALAGVSRNTYLYSWSCSRALGPQTLVFAVMWSNSSSRTLLQCLHFPELPWASQVQEKTLILLSEFTSISLCFQKLQVEIEHFLSHLLSVILLANNLTIEKYNFDLTPIFCKITLN